MAYERIGFLLSDREETVLEALTAFRNSLTIRERLVEVDPSNAGWQHDVALAYQPLILGYLFITHEKEKAGRLLTVGRKIMQQLHSLSPDNSRWKKDLAWYEKQMAALGK